MENNIQNNFKKSGILFAIVGASGSGKTTLSKYITEEFKFEIIMAPTYTTRTIRKNEIDKIDYNFVSEKEFLELKNSNFFLETVEIHSNLYGTPNEYIDRLNNGENLITSLNLDGLISWKKRYENTNSILIDCPNDNLENRLKKREESDVFIQERLKIAKIEKELNEKNKAYFNFELLNIELEKTKIDLKKIINNILKK